MSAPAIAIARASVGTRPRMKSGTVTTWMPTPAPATRVASHQRVNRLELNGLRAHASAEFCKN